MSVELKSNSFFGKYIAPRFDEMVKLDIEPGAKEEILQLMVKGGRLLMYGDHQGHGDGWLLSHAVGYLRKKAQEAGVDFPGVVLPLARSMFTGDQGWILKKMTELSAPILEKRGLRLIPYTRNKDVAKYGLEKNGAEVREMARAARKGYNFCYLPEASIQGGRHKNIWGFFIGGEINGMIDVDDKDGFFGFYDLISRFGFVKGETFFQPVVMEGSYRFMGADFPIPTLELLQDLFVNASNPAQITIERPITTARLRSEFREDWHSDGAGLSKFLMEQVARRLPHASRGIHRNVSESEAEPIVLNSLT